MIHTVCRERRCAHRCDARDRTGPACRVERDGGASDRAGAARAASAGTAHRPVRRELAEAVCALWPGGSCAAAIPGRSGRGGGSCWASGARHAAPLALCGTMGPEWNDLGLSYTCELAADAAELDGDGALHRLPLRGRAACLRLTGKRSKAETLLRSRAAQERLLLETAALCRAHGTAQVELAVRDLLPDCDPAPLVSRLQALLAERGGGLTLACRGPARSAGRPRCWLGWLPLPDGARCARSSGAAAGKNYWRTMTMRRATAAAFGRSGSAGAKRWPGPADRSLPAL